ncbi:unnamed protein product [Orchesella dallaii]|uniref:THAP9-like helix-turn-helix domain-containing protein n=1 Tax=Orchesella dallaii TaxID=48710 RepID=A0ABP1S508_9HEXA
MLSLSNANEWSDKVAEYGIALSLCEEEVLKLKRRVRELEEVADQKQKKIHVLTQQSRRQQKRKTEELPSTSAKKPKIIKTIDSSTQTSFLSLEPISPAEVILKEISDRLIDPHSPYSDTLKNFSFELHYKSPAAYSHLREKLEKALPHPINFNRWTKHIVADPGTQ